MIFDIIKYLLYIPLVVALYHFYLTICLVIKYKRMYGKDVAVKFFPFFGQFFFMKYSLYVYKDEYYFLKKFQMENPNAKGLLVLSGLINFLYIFDNDWVRMFSQDSHLFVKGDNAFNYSYFYSEAIFFVPHKNWKRHRLFLNSNFHFDALKSKVQLVKDSTKAFGEELALTNNKFTKVNLAHEVQKITSEVLIQSFFGQSFKGVKILDQEFCLLLAEMINQSFEHSFINPLFLLKKYFLGSDIGSKYLLTSNEKDILVKQKALYEFVENKIEQLISEEKSKHSNPNDIVLENNFMHLYIKEYLVQQYNKGKVEYKPEDIVTIREMIHQFFHFFLAGMDATSTVVSLTIYELAKNQAIYDKLMAEINQTIPDFDNIQHSDLSKLPYLDMILKETLRMYPITISIFPRYSEQPYQREDLFIEKNLYTLHKLTTYNGKGTSPLFEDPFVYNPERFKPGNTYNTYDYIPFSVGPRNCIGQHLGMIQAKIITAYILKNYDIKSLPDYKLVRSQQFMYLPVDKELIQLQKK